MSELKDILDIRLATLDKCENDPNVELSGADYKIYPILKELALLRTQLDNALKRIIELEKAVGVNK